MTKKFIYFTGLTLENVRAFGTLQELSLTSNPETPSPAQWTLIIGENGVGKTTLLQCLAYMRPVPSKRKSDRSPDAPQPVNEKPDTIDPAVSDASDNQTFQTLARVGENVDLSLTAHLSSGSSLRTRHKSTTSSIFTNLIVEIRDGKVETIKTNGSDIVDFKEPLVIGYGAGRHMREANSGQAASSAGAESLFDSSIELANAEKILQDLDYSQLKKEPGAGKLLKRLLAALATILPDIGDPKNIEIHGPSSLGLKGKKGVYARTPYGLVPFSSLSLGYQTVSAWTIDLAWRLFQEFPDSPNPLSEPAIVLVDEIDLHLHPKWQRQIRKELSEHFPNVQFIATAHSPLMAQTYLDANLAVIRRESNQAVIVNDPLVVKDWRLDQVVTSELFGFDSARPPDVEEKMKRQVELVQKKRKTPSEKRELDLLDRSLSKLPTAELHTDNEALEIIRRAAKLLEVQPIRS